MFFLLSRITRDRLPTLGSDGSCVLLVRVRTAIRYTQERNGRDRNRCQGQVAHM
jgi:hypothetical protein